MAEKRLQDRKRNARAMIMPHPEETLPFQVGTAFYRPQMRYIRDLGVLAAIAYRQQTGQLQTLEPMGASGIRSLRYGLEAGAEWIWANDANPDLASVLEQNLHQHLSPSRYRVSSWDAQRVFAHCIGAPETYDLVDVDGFGKAFSLIPFLWPALKPGGLLYWTATDGQIVGGHDPDRCLQRYGTYGRSLPCAQEQALRIVIGRLAAAAQHQGCSVEPLFSTFTGQTYRVMVRRVRQMQTPWSDRYGFLGYCHHCGAYQVVDWRKLSQATCPQHDPPRPLTLSGPLWLGDLHHPGFLQELKAIAVGLPWVSDPLLQLLDAMAAEVGFPPYHYSLGSLGKWTHGDPPHRDRFLQILEDRGYRSAVLHWNRECFKTTAPWHTCLDRLSLMNDRGDKP